MFTGIIEHTGKIIDLDKNHDFLRIKINTTLDTQDLKIGDSIALDGVCLTATKLKSINNKNNLINFDIGHETLSITNLKNLELNQNIHLEKTLKFSDRLNGHLVQGHVDGMGHVLEKNYIGENSENLILKISAPESILKYSIHKGSITVNGVSLTVNKLESNWFEICLIPHTLKITNLGNLNIGDYVNLEADLIGKYVEKLIKAN